METQSWKLFKLGLSYRFEPLEPEKKTIFILSSHQLSITEMDALSLEWSFASIPWNSIRSSISVPSKNCTNLLLRTRCFESCKISYQETSIWILLLVQICCHATSRYLYQSPYVSDFRFSFVLFHFKHEKFVTFYFFFLQIKRKQKQNWKTAHPSFAGNDSRIWKSFVFFSMTG